MIINQKVFLINKENKAEENKQDENKDSAAKDNQAAGNQSNNQDNGFKYKVILGI